MFRKSIRQKIVGIAAGLIVLAVIASLLSMVLASRVGHLLDELTNRYIPAYGHLVRVNIRSMERSLALRRMVMAKMQVPPDEAAYSAARKTYDDIDPVLTGEAAAARKLIDAIIQDPDTPSNNAELGRIDDRIDNAINDLHRRLAEENATLLRQLEDRAMAGVKQTMARTDELRDEFHARIESIRADMLAQVAAAAMNVMTAQNRAIVISATVTATAAVLGFVFAMLVGSGITRPVMRLLEGTREVEAGRLDGSITITTQDEIGQLSAAFNRMIETLRHNQKIRETFGRYINPRIAEGLLEQPAIAATEGQRRIMTVMFCDMKGFTSLSEVVTPRGLVKIMNLYLSTMSEPLNAQRGTIDKYIGDAIMAYWGAPFVEETEKADLAALAALDMIGRVAGLRKELPELLGVRAIPTDCDVRIGIATGEALVGSIGSELMMSYTVMGDTVNLASRQQALRLPLPDLGGHRRRLRRCNRAARDRSPGGRRPDAAAIRLRGHGEEGRGHLSADAAAAALRGRTCRVPRAPLGRRDTSFRGGARCRVWRRPVNGVDGASGRVHENSTGGGLGWDVADGA